MADTWNERFKKLEGDVKDLRRALVEHSDTLVDYDQRIRRLERGYGIRDALVSAYDWFMENPTPSTIAPSIPATTAPLSSPGTPTVSPALGTATPTFYQRYIDPVVNWFA